MSKDEQQNQRPDEDFDRFSNFMFGRRRSDDSNTAEEAVMNANVPAKQHKHAYSDNEPNRIDDWLFGPRRNEHVPRASQTQDLQSQIEHLLNNVDYGLLMETIEQFIAVSKMYKPMLKQAPSFFKEFINDFKSNE